MRRGGCLDLLDPQAVTDHVGHDQRLATRRFPLRQKDKVRIIDDGLDSGLNSSYSSFNKLKLSDGDALATMTMTILRCCTCLNGYRLLLSDGRVLNGTPHQFWQENPALLGATIDLKSAYKQVGVRPKENWYKVRVAHSPVHKKPAHFLSQSLPFGSAASVYCFIDALEVYGT